MAQWMASRTILDDEPGRLAAVRRLGLLDTAAEEPFEHIISLVRSVLKVPMAAVTLVDGDRQWFKARRGIDAPETPRSQSMCNHAIRQTVPFLVPDARHDPRFCDNPLVTGEPGIGSYAGIPLRMSDGYQVGALCAIDHEARTFSESEIAMLGNFARIVENELELRSMADHDTLTGALTRRAFLERIEDALARFRRQARPACLLLVDLDHFKSINDTYGHPAGDVVLREAVARLTATKRPDDVLARLGGEEFAILLGSTDLAEGQRIAETLRAALANEPVVLPGGPFRLVTASFGLAPVPFTDAPEGWLASADAALYAAKSKGRNRCEVAQDKTPGDEPGNPGAPH